MRYEIRKISDEKFEVWDTKFKECIGVATNQARADSIVELRNSSVHPSVS
jgi:hypothetical protein